MEGRRLWKEGGDGRKERRWKEGEAMEGMKEGRR
jgi:hypothetical protein